LGYAHGGSVSDPLTLVLLIVLVICLAFATYYLLWREKPLCGTFSPKNASTDIS
jgi:hypothetical protein